MRLATSSRFYFAATWTSQAFVATAAATGPRSCSRPSLVANGSSSLRSAVARIAHDAHASMASLAPRRFSPRIAMDRRRNQTSRLVDSRNARKIASRNSKIIFVRSAKSCELERHRLYLRFTAYFCNTFVTSRRILMDQTQIDRASMMRARNLFP